MRSAVIVLDATGQERTRYASMAAFRRARAPRVQLMQHDDLGLRGIVCVSALEVGRIAPRIRRRTAPM